LVYPRDGTKKLGWGGQNHQGKGIDSRLKATREKRESDGGEKIIPPTTGDKLKSDCNT